MELVYYIYVTTLRYFRKNKIAADPRLLRRRPLPRGLLLLSSSSQLLFQHCSSTNTAKPCTMLAKFLVLCSMSLTAASVIERRVRADPLLVDTMMAADPLLDTDPLLDNWEKEEELADLLIDKIEASKTSSPTMNPTTSPSEMPSTAPSEYPTLYPSSSPSSVPSVAPSTTQYPSSSPTVSAYPSAFPSSTPSTMPSSAPSISSEPTSSPSSQVSYQMMKIYDKKFQFPFSAMMTLSH